MAKSVSSSTEGKMVVMGRIVAPYGVFGWLKVVPDTEVFDGLLDYETWWLGKGSDWRELAVESAKVHNDVLVVKLKGIDDRDKALACKGKQIAIPRDQLPEMCIRDRRTIVANFKGNNSAPAWSPDGNKLAIVLTYGANSQVYTINTDGSGLKQITKSTAIDTEPTWSNDGNWIYFTSDRGGRPQIYKVSSDGGDSKRVSFEGAYNVSPRFSPDGKSLAMIRNDGGKFRVALQDLASGQVQLLSEGSQDESPSFAPNGRVILYATRAGGRGEMCIRDIH